MKRFTTNRFTYTKSDDDVSERVAFVLSTPSDMYLTIDLSEFTEQEQIMYADALTEIHKEYTEGIREELKQLGLSGNYRNFKAYRITQDGDDQS